jgi:hypothetical protein
MNKDFRLSVGFIGHPKTVKLRRRIGADGVLSLIALYGFTAQNKPDGRLAGMSEEDIAIAAGWSDDPVIFISGLMECRFLDDVDGAFVIHDWAMHNGWAANAQARSEQSRSAAEQRWERKRAMPNRADSNAVSIDQHSGPNKPALPKTENSNAPIPSPSPIPSQENPPFTPQGGNDAHPSGLNGRPTASVFAWAPARTKAGTAGKTLPDVPITLEKVAEWRAAFPRLDVEAEIHSCIQWMRDNPDKVGPGAVGRVGNWLRNATPAQAKPPASLFVQAGPANQAQPVPRTAFEHFCIVSRHRADYTDAEIIAAAKACQAERPHEAAKVDAWLINHGFGGVHV